MVFSIPYELFSHPTSQGFPQGCFLRALPFAGTRMGLGLCIMHDGSLDSDCGLDRQSFPALRPALLN